MGVYISGLKIPPKGKGAIVILCSSGAVYSDGQKVGTAIPVPPHGRLIDANALTDCLATLLQFPSNLVNGQWIVNTIREQPTIIPAEEVYGQYTDTAGNFRWCGTHSGEHTIKAKEGER